MWTVLPEKNPVPSCCSVLGGCQGIDIWMLGCSHWLLTDSLPAGFCGVLFLINGKILPALSTRWEPSDFPVMQHDGHVQVYAATTKKEQDFAASCLTTFNRILLYILYKMETMLHYKPKKLQIRLRLAHSSNGEQTCNGFKVCSLTLPILMHFCAWMQATGRITT